MRSPSKILPKYSNLMYNRQFCKQTAHPLQDASRFEIGGRDPSETSIRTFHEPFVLTTNPGGPLRCFAPAQRWAMLVLRGMLSARVLAAFSFFLLVRYVVWPRNFSRPNVFLSLVLAGLCNLGPKEENNTSFAYRSCSAIAVQTTAYIQPVLANGTLTILPYATNPYTNVTQRIEDTYISFKVWSAGEVNRGGGYNLFHNLSQTAPQAVRFGYTLPSGVSVTKTVNSWLLPNGSCTFSA